MAMRRINIVIDEELDDRVEAEAHTRGVSKSQVVRESLEQSLPPRDDDPWLAIIGGCDGEPLRADESIDDIVYGRKAHD